MADDFDVNSLLDQLQSTGLSSSDALSAGLNLLPASSSYGDAGGGAMALTPYQFASSSSSARPRGRRINPGLRSAFLTVLRIAGVQALIALASALGWDGTSVAQMLFSSGKRRGRGITFRQLSNARRVNRTIDGMYHQLHAGHGRRRGGFHPVRHRRRRR